MLKCVILTVIFKIHSFVTLCVPHTLTVMFVLILSPILENYHKKQQQHKQRSMNKIGVQI